MTKQGRARNLDDKGIADIVAMLDGWRGKLTWELLIEEVERRQRQTYTRQALSKHARIADAFRHRKNALTEAAPLSGRRRVGDPSQELEVALQQIQLLEAANSRLEMENKRLLDQFIRWAHNAYTRGLDKNFLDQPLPTVQVDSTTVTMEELTRRRR